MYSRTIILSLAAIAALGCLAQETYTERIAGSQTDVQITEQRQPLPVEPQSSDSLVEVRTLEVRTYMDTLRVVSEQQVPVDEPADPTSRKGHHVQFQIGGGVGSIVSAIRDELTMPASGTGYELFGVSALVQLQYAWYFHKNWGIGLGLWMTNYTSHGYLGGDVIYSGAGINDSDGENYEHHAQINRWHEKQIIHTVGVPVSIQAQTWNKRNTAGFFADLGAAPSYAVMSSYRLTEGEIEHWQKLPQRGGAEVHQSHEFTTVDYANGGSPDVKQKGTVAVKPLITAFADMGVLIKMSKQTNLLLGLYGQYTVNNIQNSSQRELAWRDSRYPCLDVPLYDGMLATTNIKHGGALHPWEAGVKIGVHWYNLDKPRTTTVMRNDTTLQPIARYDSVWTARIDTLGRMLPPSTEHIQRMIDTLNRVYFAFDSHQLSEESMRCLDLIAEQLKTIPNKIMIGGHASKEGTHAHNERLAHYRALMVKYYLVDRGIPATRMIVKSYGTSMPNAINIHGDLSLDRRVEIIVQEE